MYDNINSNDHHLIPPSAGGTFDQCIELYEHIWEAGSRLVYLHSKSITVARGEPAGDQFSSKTCQELRLYYSKTGFTVLVVYRLFIRIPVVWKYRSCSPKMKVEYSGRMGILGMFL